MVMFVLNTNLGRTSLLKVADPGWWTDTFKNLCKGLGELTSVHNCFYNSHVADLKMQSRGLNEKHQPNAWFHPECSCVNDTVTDFEI